MSSWPSSDEPGAPVTLTVPELLPGHILHSSSSCYSIVEFIGEGCFGKVAKCQNVATKETVAMKILKKGTCSTQDIETEVSMLKTISVLSPDRTNMVKFFEQFDYMGQTCLAFEMLDMSLYQLLEELHWEPLILNEIRPIAKQLLVALDALKGLGVLHTDIKPDNIMLVNKRDQPFRVKLIDFGLAIPASMIQPGMELQPLGYMAPEIALGLPFTEAIDVWGVGCILVVLFLADNPFPVDCEYQMMKCMVEVLGQPEDHLLRAGKYTKRFFIEEKAADGPAWRLMTPEEYKAANNCEPQKRGSFANLSCSLDGLAHIYQEEEAVEFKDREAFVDLVKQLLHFDGDQRISPRQALQHPFITMSHLSPETPEGRDYLTAAQTMMRVCSVEDSASINDPPASRSLDGIGPAVLQDIAPTTGSSNPSSDEDPAAWSPDSGLPSVSNDEDPESSDGAEDEDHNADAPAAGSSDGGLHSLSSNGEECPGSFEEDPEAARSSDGAQQTDAASASSGRKNKFLKRIRRFFTRIADSFSCCWRPNVED